MYSIKLKSSQTCVICFSRWTKEVSPKMPQMDSFWFKNSIPGSKRRNESFFYGDFSLTFPDDLFCPDVNVSLRWARSVLQVFKNREKASPPAGGEKLIFSARKNFRARNNL